MGVVILTSHLFWNEVKQCKSEFTAVMFPDTYLHTSQILY